MSSMQRLARCVPPAALFAVFNHHDDRETPKSAAARRLTGFG
jgi:hypothetical protein